MSGVVVGLMLTGCGAGPTVDQSRVSSGTPNVDGSGAVDPKTRAYLHENAETLADQYQLSDPPEVDFVRFVSGAEWASTQIACLNEAGFDASLTDDGEGVRYPPISDESLAESLDIAIYSCSVMYPIDIQYTLPFSVEQLRALYVYRTQDLLQCLHDEGVEVPADPPSEAVFVESEGMWTPFEYVALTDENIRRIYRECPQTPESIYG